MSRRRTLRIALAAATLVLAAACGKDDTPAPPTAPPPASTWIAEVGPPPRSVGVMEDVPIWVRFAHAPDPATLNLSTVFLKLDTRRIPITLAWDAATQTLRIRPTDPLLLRRTHTVELSPEIRDPAGSRMGAPWFWQFTLNSVRRLHSPSPMHGSVGASPLGALHWGGLTEASAGQVEYEVRVAADSLAAFGGTPVGRVAGGRWVPRARFPQDAPLWWTVTAHNLSTGERMSGPAWRFQCLPVTTPAETLLVPCAAWAWEDIYRGTVGSVTRCMGDSVVAGAIMNAYYRWEPGPPDTTLRLADAWIELQTFPHYESRMGPEVTIWGAGLPWAECGQMKVPGPPWVDEASGALAAGEALPDRRVRLHSDALAAHIEAVFRDGDRPAWFLRHPVRVAFRPGWAGFDAVRLRIVVYRVPVQTAAGSW